MNTIQIPCAPGKISDGFHTFDELYEHRAVLFLAVMRAHHSQAWFSELHNDGTMFPGYFVAGMNLPAGQITYHLQTQYLDRAKRTGAACLKKAPKFDGHTSNDVYWRLWEWL